MTDLELMQLLDEQGYEATLENLQILKEGLERGEYVIKDATEDRKPEELTSDIDNEDIYGDDEETAEDVEGIVVESFSDYELYQLLENEGYETTNENLVILKEGLHNGEIELLDEGLIKQLGIRAKTAIKRGVENHQYRNAVKGYNAVNDYISDGKNPDSQKQLKILKQKNTDNKTEINKQAFEDINKDKRETAAKKISKLTDQNVNEKDIKIKPTSVGFGDSKVSNKSKK